jgi:hypothetical protein
LQTFSWYIQAGTKSMKTNREVSQERSRKNDLYRDF